MASLVHDIIKYSVLILSLINVVLGTCSPLISKSEIRIFVIKLIACPKVIPIKQTTNCSFSLSNQSPTT